jgi:hypothetical protein
MSSSPAPAEAATPIPVPRLSLRPAPEREPPFDDEIPARYLHLVGPWDQELPFEAAAAEHALRRAPIVAVRDGVAASEAGRPASERQAPAQSPERAAAAGAEQWSRRFFIALLEGAAGRRSMSQLSRHTTLSVLEALRADTAACARLAPGRQPGSVRTVRAFLPTARVAEVSAVIQVGPRFRAVAARLERTAVSWRCVRLQIG